MNRPYGSDPIHAYSGGGDAQRGGKGDEYPVELNLDDLDAAGSKI